MIKCNKEINLHKSEKWRSRLRTTLKSKQSPESKHWSKSTPVLQTWAWKAAAGITLEQRMNALVLWMKLPRAAGLYKSDELEKAACRPHHLCICVLWSKDIGELSWYTFFFCRYLDRCFQNYSPPYLSSTSPFHLNGLFIGPHTPVSPKQD